ncbi:hypothetical protein GIB67_002022, partial [Kingdonia uniflora]
ETDSVPHSIWNVKDMRTFLIRLPYSTYIPKFSADLKSLQHLTSLRILDLSRAHIEELPNEVGNLILLRLTHLQTLSKFIVSEECKISYLKDLNKLKGSLEIINIKGETQEAGAAELKSKEHLRVLKLRFSDASFNDGHDQVHRVLDLLEPHPNLEELEIYSYNGSKFPKLDGVSRKRITIHYAASTNNQSRRTVEVRDGGSLGTLVFPKLRKLRMSDMENWEEWVMRTTEDSLRELSITDCPVLRISCIPKFLETLNLYGDSGFTVSKIFSNADRSLNKQLRDKKEKKRDYWEVVSETLPATVGEEDSSGVGAILRDSEGTSHGVCEGKVVPKTITVHELEALDWGWTWLLGLFGEELTW